MPNSTLADRYLARKKSASHEDATWFARQLELALDTLKDAVDVADAQGPEGESLSMTNAAVARAVQNIRHNLSADLHRHVVAIKQSAGRTAAAGRPLDQKTRQKVNQLLNRSGLDGNTYYSKAESGYSRAVDLMAQFGLELDSIPNSMVFTRPTGRFTVDLAWSNPADPFSPEPVPNTMLAISFHQMESGKYEVLAYLS